MDATTNRHPSPGRAGRQAIIARKPSAGAGSRSTGPAAARISWLVGWLALLTICLTPAAQADPCRQDRFGGADYLVCTVDPAASNLRLFWRDRDGAPLRSFAALARSVEAGGRKLAFAINAGMYRPDFSPVGLYVEDGVELRPADTTVMDGPPREIANFYKKPNGIFFLTERGAAILTTDEFLAQRPDARFATQSGPMLAIRGALHPALVPGSTDRTRRSGVGVCEGGLVRFAISESRVNFHEFARLFRDRLACPDALFLDGGRGAGIYSPAFSRNDLSWHGGYGPLFGLVE